jgi:hypothetical protein
MVSICDDITDVRIITQWIRFAVNYGNKIMALAVSGKIMK